MAIVRSEHGVAPSISSGPMNQGSLNPTDYMGGCSSYLSTFLGSGLGEEFWKDLRPMCQPIKIKLKVYGHRGRAGKPQTPTLQGRRVLASCFFIVGS